MRALAIGGRLIVLGLQGGRKGELDLGALLAKRATVHAAGLRGPAGSRRRRRSSPRPCSRSGR